MAKFKGVFKRVEKKYMLSGGQYNALLKIMENYMQVDAYGLCTICNIYFDTPDSRLIRESMDKPVYKEKLRLRTYGVPDSESVSFVELKKKYKGVVYKRRVALPYEAALHWLCAGEAPQGDSQIIREIKWFLQFYEDLQPTVALFYDRVALFGREDPELRITFDDNIRYRTAQTDLRAGSDGDPLLRDGTHLMEVKIGGGMPIWLSDALSALSIFPTSYSKYGSAYLRELCSAKAR